MKRAPLLPLLPRGGFVVNSVILSILLVVATTLAVAAATVVAVNRQIEQAADRRLADGATFFQTTLEATQADLAAVGAWLAREPEFVRAIQERRHDEIVEWMGLAIRVSAVDEILLADPAGSVVVRLRTGGLEPPGGNLATEPGFEQALAGQAAAGLGREGEGLLSQELYLAVRSGAETVGVLRVAALLDEADLDAFRSRTGLDASLFFGQSRLVTTLRGPDGARLTAVGPEPTTLAEVVGAGRTALAWRDLPIGRVRSHYLPLAGPDGRRVGMLAVTQPVSSIQARLHDALLPLLLVTLLIVLAGAVAAYLLARRVRQPILALAAAASRLQAGDLATPIPGVPEPELQPLAAELERARLSVRANLEAVAGAEARQRALLAALHEPILTTLADGRIADCNAAAADFFGRATPLLGRPIQDLLPFVGPASGSARDATWQGRVRDATGQELDVEVSRARLAEGQLPATDVYVVRDISRHAELNRLREQLLYDVAHELRAPLAVLDNALAILASEYSELSVSEYDQIVGSARRTAARLRGLMEDLLSAGSIQAGRFVVRPEPTELQAVLAEALEVVGPLLEARDQRVDRDLPGDAPLVLADRRYLRQVLANLLTNASKYSPDGEAIRVWSERANGQVRVAVADRGPGIPAEQRAGLFERFYRVRPGHEDRGIGLGLAICKGIVEAHGGRIGVESEVGAGTCVWFTLPVVEE